MSDTATTVKDLEVIPDKKAPIKLGVTNAALTKLEKKYAEVPDGDTKEGYAAIQAAKRVLTPLRTGVEAERKTQVAAAVEHQRRVNSVANQIKTRIEAIEEPLYKEKKRVDDAAAEKKRLADEAEERRVAEIEGLVEEIQQLTEGLLGADLETLETRLAEANKLTITDEVYMEFVEPASMVLGQAKTALTNAVANAKVVAEQKAQLKEQQEAMAEQQRENDEKLAAQQKVLDDQQAEIDRQKLAHDEKVEADRLAKKEEERLILEAEEAAEREAELKARMPEDQKLRAYGEALASVAVPFIEDTALLTIQSRAVTMVEDIAKFINDNTQAPE